MKRFVIPFLLVCLLPACTVNQDLMFQTGKAFEFDELKPTQSSAYTIAANDRLQFQLYSNLGQRLIGMTAGSIEQGQNNMLAQQQRSALTYRVELDGTVELPEVGSIQLAGLTLEEAERAIEVAYESEYVKPYAILQVVNNRVLVFPGEAGQATVITLENQNTTVVEVLALAGGIRQRGRASLVKLIRPNGQDNLVYDMDLSTIEGMQAARTVVQANDIIYVDSNPQLTRELLQDIGPVAQLITTLTSLYLTYNVIKNN
jgi:polysaccharide export outer membrane protein